MVLNTRRPIWRTEFARTYRGTYSAFQTTYLGRRGAWSKEEEGREIGQSSNLNLCILHRRSKGCWRCGWANTFLPNPTQSLLHRRLFLRSTVSVVLALPTSKMSACRCRILLLGALSVRRSVVTCLFLEQEQWSSVDGVSQWLLRSSGIHYRLTYDHHW